MTSVALFLLQRQSTGISQIVGNLSAGVVLITVLIADKLHECGRFDADLDRPSALVLLPDNAVPFEEVRLFAAQIKLVAVDCFAEEESNISFIELRLNPAEFRNLLADRSVNRLPKLLVESMLITGRQFHARFDHLNHTHKGPLEQSEVILNAALARKQFSELIRTINSKIF